MTGQTHLVFVYGTLRRHEPNHVLLNQACPIAMQAKVKGSLYDTGFGYPGLIPDENDWVYGELYQVSDEQLYALDVLEGFEPGAADNEYDRTQVLAQTDMGAMDAYLYTYARWDDTLRRIVPGDWKADQMRRSPQVVYFAYGSAMDDHRMILQGVQGLFRDVLGRGELHGYELKFTIRSADGSRADIVEGNGVVEGKLYRIGQGAVDYLYMREGVYKGRYRPTFVDLECNGEWLQDVLTFVVCEKIEETPPPYWYAQEILRGAAGTVSDEYMCKLLSVFKEKFHLTFSNAEEEAFGEQLDDDLLQL